ncbi:MAG: type II secretion system protein [Candidatus Gastranaerophilaceae bacterium]
MFNKIKTAFTLAEVLIVIGIIGTVSALTVPNLLNASGDSEKITKLKITYSTLDEAFQRATSKYGNINTWCIGAENSETCELRFANYFMKYLKISKDCLSDVTSGINNGGCFTGHYHHDLMDNIDDYNLIHSEPKIILKNGVSVAFHIENSLCNIVNGNIDDICGEIYVDVDGPNKGAYTWGKDLFRFWLTKRGVLPEGLNGETDGSSSDIKITCFKYGFYCSSWVIKTGNMDYLKSTDYSSHPGLCPNGSTQLSWEVTSCK